MAPDQVPSYHNLTGTNILSVSALASVSLGARAKALSGFTHPDSVLQRYAGRLLKATPLRVMHPAGLPIPGLEEDVESGGGLHKRGLNSIASLRSRGQGNAHQAGPHVGPVRTWRDRGAGGDKGDPIRR